MKLTLTDAILPIYRVIHVPSHINFDQLHNIFQIATGFSNNYLYEFSFKEDNISITNDEAGCEESEYAKTAIGKDHMEQLGLEIPNVSMFKSKEISIAPLFKKYSQFKYIYDFADYWEHDVEVLSIKETAETHAKVTEYNGDFPPENFGGIQSLNEMLYVLKNPVLPEYDDMKKWCEELGYRVFDVNEANTQLEKLVFLSNKEIIS